MRSSTIAEAKAHFSALLSDVAEGNEVVVTRRGRPVARISPAWPEAVERFDLTALRKFIGDGPVSSSMTVAEMRANDQL